MLAYDINTHKALAEGIVKEPPKKKKKDKGGYKGGASSMSSQPSDCQSRAIAYNSELKHLAVANNTGEMTVREIDWDAVGKREPGSLDKVVHSWPTDKKKGQWIECMAYSPCNEYLAVGSHDNMIYVYLAKKKYKLFKKKMTGHSSFITALDWS